MKAAVIYAPGPPDSLQYAEIPDPSCGVGELLMRVDVISIEGGDTLSRARPLPRGAPHVVGYQASGEVLEVGPSVQGFRSGDRVSAFGFDGSHAELRVVDPRYTYHVPVGMDIVDAAVVPVAFSTAHDALFLAGRLRPGETVLVQAAGSGVGVAAIQIARHAGARVIAAASSAAKLGRIRLLEPEFLVDTSASRVADAVMELTEGRGADVVIDGVGGSMLQQSILSLAFKGRLCMIGAAGREPMMVDVSSMQRGAQSLIGVFLGGQLATPRVRQMIQGYLHEVARGTFKTVIDRRFTLAEAAQAHAYIERRQAVGRVVMTTSSYQANDSRPTQNVG